MDIYHKVSNLEVYSYLEGQYKLVSLYGIAAKVHVIVGGTYTVENIFRILNDSFTPVNLVPLIGGATIMSAGLFLNNAFSKQKAETAQSMQWIEEGTYTKNQTNVNESLERLEDRTLTAKQNHTLVLSKNFRA